MTVRVEAIGDDSLPLLRVANAELELVFAPTRGGRLLSLVVEGRELLWRNPDLLDATMMPVVAVAEWPASDGGMSTWANVGGSKTWPAPQGWSGPDEWAGPPDPVLDSGAWNISWESDETIAVVTLTSMDDPRSGLRIKRRFSIPAHGTAFSQRVTFENVSDVTRRWSIWEVCQVDTSAAAGLPTERAAVVVSHTEEPIELDLGSYEGDVASERNGYDVLLPLGTGVAKRGYAAAGGTVEYRAPSGTRLQIGATPAAVGTYPDGGSRVEVWLQRPTPAPIRSLDDLHPTAHLVELEVLGPMTTLRPGEHSVLDIDWVVGRP